MNESLSLQALYDSSSGRKNNFAIVNYENKPKGILTLDDIRAYEIVFQYLKFIFF